MLRQAWRGDGRPVPLRNLFGVLAAALISPALAAQAPVQTPAEAMAQDAAAYAARHGVTPEDAARRLRAMDDSAALTDELRDRYRTRWAGASIAHAPFAIQIRLTGDAPVRDRVVRLGGMAVPVRFVTGAPATQDEVVRAIAVHRPTIDRLVPGHHGLGFDGRTGALVLLANSAAWARAQDARPALERLTGVPVAVRPVVSPEAVDLVSGGDRLVGAIDGRRFVCTAGFSVTDGARTGVTTAAHCPDNISVGTAPLSFAGGWGVGFQDVQVHVGEAAQPVFYADTARTRLRPVTAAAPREALRAGDTVCRRGETAGYSCAEVVFTHFAPPGALCAGPCDPVWVAVSGPSCAAGDSGGPVFRGTRAFGIIKGATTTSGRCDLYYYMSTDYLPAPWSLLRGRPAD